MTTDIIGQRETDVANDQFYALSGEVLESRGRNPAYIVMDRLCEAGKRKAGGPDAWKTRRFDELRKIAREDCAGQEDYLSPQHPLLETVFRILLVARQDHLSLSDIYQQLVDLWMNAPAPRHITGETLQRVLDHGARYGIVRVEPTE